ncbi:hypothetical protein IG631_13591 [Alternaria alternata]|nr:hypothetical protein IG631_13591 [Alternaria alternata]
MWVPLSGSFESNVQSYFSVPGPETKRYPHTRTHGTDCLGARNEHLEQHGAADKKKVVVDGFGEVARGP